MLQIVSEVAHLIRNVSNSGNVVVDTLAWLTMNSLSSDRLQNVQLQLQNVGAVWRRLAVHHLLSSDALAAPPTAPTTPTPPPALGTEGGGEARARALARWADVFREPLDREVSGSVEEAEGVLKRTLALASKRVGALGLGPSHVAQGGVRLQALQMALRRTSASGGPARGGQGAGVPSSVEAPGTPTTAEGLADLLHKSLLVGPGPEHEEDLEDGSNLDTTLER